MEKDFMDRTVFYIIANNGYDALGADQKIAALLD